MEYYPNKHTIAYSVMELFKSKPAATRLGTGAIADALDQPRESIIPCIKPCLEHQLLNKVIENGITYFELGEAAYKPVPIRLGRNDRPKNLARDHGKGPIDEEEAEEDDPDSYKPPPVALAKDNHPEHLTKDPDRVEPIADENPPLKDGAVVEIGETKTDKALLDKLKKAVADKKQEDAVDQKTRTVSESMAYSYHSNGSVTINKSGQQITLTVEECLVVAKFINAVDTFERVRKFATKQKNQEQA